MGKQITLWFLANALLPIVVPALFLAVVAWFIDGSFPLKLLLEQLIKEGFYIFSALTLVFSLYEEYGLLKKCVGPLMQTWLVLMAIATLGMFYVMRKDATTNYVAAHQLQFYVIWIATAISAIVIKFKILRLKTNIGL